MRAGLLLLLTVWASAAWAEEPVSLAYFGVKLTNGSSEPLSEAEEARRAVAERQLAEALEASGKYTFVDVSPVAGKADLYENLADCNGCDARLAEELGADAALTAEIYKTSNLILHLTVYIRDAGTGTLVGGGSADMRGNTDETWRRAVSYVVRNRILK